MKQKIGDRRLKSLYRQAAVERYESDDDIQVDTGARVVLSENEDAGTTRGAWVQVWVWVDKDEAEPRP